MQRKSQSFHVRETFEWISSFSAPSFWNRTNPANEVFFFFFSGLNCNIIIPFYENTTLILLKYYLKYVGLQKALGLQMGHPVSGLIAHDMGSFFLFLHAVDLMDWGPEKPSDPLTAWFGLRYDCEK